MRIITSFDPLTIKKMTLLVKNNLLNLKYFFINYATGLSQIDINNEKFFDLKYQRFETKAVLQN